MKKALITINGITPLLMNNPQTVDPFNKFSKEKKKYTARKSKTEDDLMALRKLDIESKTYFDDTVGVYVPTRWMTEQIVTSAFGVIKVGKDKMRGGIFSTEDKAKLTYRGMKKVKAIGDIVMDEEFHHRMILPQQNVRIAKDAPIFRDWSFSTVIEFDPTIVDLAGLTAIVKRGAMYVGFGDFRPTFGRAKAEITEVFADE